MGRRRSESKRIGGAFRRGTETGVSVLLEAIIVGAAGAVGVTALGRRLFFSPVLRVPGRPGGVHGQGTGVQGLDPWSPPHTETGAADHAESTPSPGRVQGTKPENTRISTAPRTVQMGVGDQVRSFVAWMLDYTDGAPTRLSDKRTVKNYQRWAEEWNVVPIPASLLLAGLKAHPQVRYKRDRILDQHGRALRNEAGTPLRGSFYTFAMAQPKATPKLPGRVPVTDLVPHAPLLSKPRAPSVGASGARSAPAPEPMRRAA